MPVSGVAAMSRGVPASARSTTSSACSAAAAAARSSALAVSLTASGWTGPQTSFAAPLPRSEVVLVEYDAVPVDQVQVHVVCLDIAVRRRAQKVLERREPHDGPLASPGRTASVRSANTQPAKSTWLAKSSRQELRTAGLYVSTSTRFQSMRFASW